MSTKFAFSSPRFKPLLLTASIALLAGSNPGYADDVEVYLSPSPNPVGPNMLFVLDESGSMAWDAGGRSRSDTDPRQRMYQLKQAMRTIINDPAMDNVNAAILGYRGDPAVLRVHQNFARVGQNDNRDDLLDAVNGLVHSGSTPSSPAIRDAVQWYRGQKNGYDSPIGAWCEPNYIVFLTDGEPNVNYSYINNSYSYEGTNCRNNEVNYSWSNTSGDDDGALCSATYAQYAYNHRPTDPANRNWVNWTSADLNPDLQLYRNVVTHTVGFTATAGSDREAYLLEIAEKSRDVNHPEAAFSNGYATDDGSTYTGGRYSRAANAADLVSAFQDFVTAANSEVEYTYNAPVIPFNPNNVAVSGDYIYVPLFKPEAKSFWRGNLKKYRIGINDQGVVRLTGADGENPLRNDLSFSDTGRSYWTTGSDDGSDPLAGGVAQQMKGSRRLLTHIPGNPVELFDASNLVEDANDLITSSMLGAATATERTELLQWITWTDTGNAHEGTMGAPLHTQPVVVRYSGTQDVIYMSTSEGVVHAIDDLTGAELWSFMPDEVFRHIKEIKANATATKPLYGVDGPLVTYESAGRKFLVISMRRGGRNMYALDITDRSSPKLAWEIIGGVTSGFANLGQTWSAPKFAKINSFGSPRDVLIFGGGYDPVQDTVTGSRQTDSYGNAIYIVDARLGPGWSQVITRTGGDLNIGEMRNGIVSEINVIDLDSNDYADRLYASDVGGRIIRVDLKDDATQATAMQGGVIADVNAGFANRRFFTTPEVGYVSQGGVRYLAVLIGSGFRPSPLDASVGDRFYMIKDPAVFAAPTTYVAVREGDLIEVDGTGTPPATPMGWYYDLPGNGEKVFSRASLHNSVILFTTYKGERSNDNADRCSAANTIGEARFYAMDLLTGDAVFANMDGDDVLEPSDRSRALRIPGLPPGATLLFPGDENDAPTGKVIALVGLEEALRWPDKLLPIYWEEHIGEGGY